MCSKHVIVLGDVGKCVILVGEVSVDKRVIVMGDIDIM